MSWEAKEDAQTLVFKYFGISVQVECWAAELSVWHNESCFNGKWMWLRHPNWLRTPRLLLLLNFVWVKMYISAIILVQLAVFASFEVEILKMENEDFSLWAHSRVKWINKTMSMTLLMKNTSDFNFNFYAREI